MIIWGYEDTNYNLTPAVNNGIKHMVDYVRQPDGKSLEILEWVIWILTLFVFSDGCKKSQYI